MYDNAPVNFGQSVSDELRLRNFITRNWPPLPLNLNPIEIVYKWMIDLILNDYLESTGVKSYSTPPDDDTLEFFS